MVPEFIFKKMPEPFIPASANEIQNGNYNKKEDYKAFELLYDKYAPKALGFISQYINSKEKAEEFLIIVFLRVWNDIKSFDEKAEKQFLRILLLVWKQFLNKVS